jgi:hypothetical protein
LAYFAVKTSVVFFVVVLMRIALPRLRIDQMLNFNWKFLTPLALILVMVTAVVEKAVIHYLPLFNLVPGSTTFLIVRTLAHLFANGAIAIGALWLAQSLRKREIPRVGSPRPVAVPPQAKPNQPQQVFDEGVKNVS